MLQADAVLEHDTERDRRESLSRIPVELSETYTVTLERIKQQPRTRSERAFSILNWVVYAQKQLRVIELRHALALKAGDTAFNPTGMPPENALVDCCLGLVVIERETSTIRLTHFTLQEYFNDHREFLNPLGHMMIAKTCLTYLGFNHPGRTHQKIIESSPFIKYVGSNVGHHLRKRSDGETDRQIVNFLSNKDKLQILDWFWEESSYFFRETPISPLHWVAFFGITSAARLLLKSIEARNSPDTMTPDLWATTSSRILGSLSTPNYTLNARDKYDRTPLCLAAGNGHDAVVRLLINTPGIDLNARDSGSQTPLSLAAENGHDAVVQLLINTPGIDLNARDKHGQTPLSSAANNGRDVVVRLLIDTPGIDLNAGDEHGQTPLYIAAARGHNGVVRLLTGTPGIDINAGDRHGQTPLYMAAAYGHDAVVQLLINAPSIDLNAGDSDGRTPLWYAAAYGYDAVVRLLVSPGIDLNAGDSYDRTPLCLAAENGHNAVVRLLINAPGIDLNAGDSGGQTLLFWAAQNGHDAVVRLLTNAPGIDLNPAQKT
jgi:ankyrin repeat protein